jgi:hypothetical protein
MVQRLARGHDSLARFSRWLVSGVGPQARHRSTAFCVCSTNRGTARGSVFSVGAAKGRALEARLFAGRPAAARCTQGQGDFRGGALAVEEV